MRAVVFHGIGDIRLDDVPEPRLEQPLDAVVRLIASAICGTDLHMIRGTLTGMKPGTILGHEGVGIVEEVGKGVRNLRPGDRVVIPSTIACGACPPCREGLFSQCLVANPNGPDAGTAFFGGPESTGPFHGLQAERARIPYANVGLVKLPDDVSDDQAILISDIFPTGWFGADLASIKPGATVCVLGCGPVGLFAMTSARLMGAARIFGVDAIASRLDAARDLGVEVIDYDAEDPLEVVRELTGGLGVDAVIDAVGVDANRPHAGPAKDEKRAKKFDEEVSEVAPETHEDHDNWHPGDAPSQALSWAVKLAKKAGHVALVGVYPPSLTRFPIGEAMEKNLTLRAGNCHHRKYIPKLVELVRTNAVDPTEVLSHREPLADALEAYRAFDRRDRGWMKVELVPAVVH